MADPFVLGWEEWVSLPDLQLPAIKAKVDTGAKTSSLHAFVIEPIQGSARPMVRFGVHPVPGRNDVAVTCTAEVIDHREVTSSNGDSERRYVIRTTLKIGDRMWPIELTLANRESMNYRMLIGRQAIQDDMLVDVASSFRHPRSSYRVYDIPPRPAEERRPLRIGLLTRRPENATNRRLLKVAARRGHQIVMIDRNKVSLFIDTRDPAILMDGSSITCDAAIVRPGRGTPTFSAAVARQLETLGAVVLNGADAVQRIADVLATRQLLARAGLAVPAAAVSHVASPGNQDAPDRAVVADSIGHSLGPLVRVLVVGTRAIAAIMRDAHDDDEIDREPEWRIAEGERIEATLRLAERVSRTLELELAGVDITITPTGPMVLDVTVAPPISLLERVTGAALSEAIIVYIEQTVRLARSTGGDAASSP